MGILNGIKTKKVNEEMEIFEKVGKYVVYEPSEEVWAEITDLFTQADQEKLDDGRYQTTFGKEATIKLFQLLTNIDMTEKTYDTYATKRNVRLMLVQQYIIEVVQTYLKLGMTSIENERLGEDLGVEKPKNRNDKTVILDKMRKNEAERKAKEIVDKGIETGHIVEVVSDHIPDVGKKVEDMTDDELDAELKRLEKIAKVKRLQAELGE